MARALRTPTDRQSIVIVNGTGGQGVWVRREPGGDPIRVWPDGTPMLVVGADQQADGRTWRNVWTLDGVNGWTAADYLEPADRDMVAAALAAAGAAGSAGSTGQATPAGQTASAPAATSTRPPSTPTPNPSQSARLPGAPTATPTPAQAASAPTATPASGPPAAPTATPIRAPAGTRSIAVNDVTMTQKSMVQAMSIKIGNRPRPGMELVGVQIAVANEGRTAAAIYRSDFRLSLADQSRVEPLAGPEPALPYSSELATGEEIEGWLTFEVPSGTRPDALIWTPDHKASYAVGF